MRNAVCEGEQFMDFKLHSPFSPTGDQPQAIEKLTEEGEGMGIRKLMKTPMFWLAIILMVCAGASELSMSQWASAYTEAALGFPKSIGDIAGPCMFAVTMGISRVIYGKFGASLDLGRYMIGSGILCLCCYLLASLSPNPVLGLIGCIFCGFSVGIMWPGTISISSRKCPRGGTAMFAFLALAGDLGAAVGPMMVGGIADAVGGDLKMGLLVAAAFPALLFLGVLVLLKKFGSTKRE